MKSTKICNKCKIEKEIERFGKYKNSKDGLKNTCKECRILEGKKRYEENINYFINYRKNKHEIILKRNEDYRKKNSEKRKEYYRNNEKKEKQYASEYRKKNIEKIRIYYNNKYKTNDLFRLKNIIRNRINKKIRNLEGKKSKKTVDILGCSIEHLKLHIQSMFTEGMSWENRGVNGWHIDHIIPLSSAKSVDELEKLCHYTNLQPLWSEDNFTKGDKII